MALGRLLAQPLIEENFTLTIVPCESTKYLAYWLFINQEMYFSKSIPA